MNRPVGTGAVPPGSALKGLLLPQPPGKDYGLLKIVTQPATADQLTRLGDDRAIKWELTEREDHRRDLRHSQKASSGARRRGENKMTCRNITDPSEPKPRSRPKPRRAFDIST
jgi:hypothetical protein